jgi:hypothetical protein
MNATQPRVLSAEVKRAARHQSVTLPTAEDWQLRGWNDHLVPQLNTVLVELLDDLRSEGACVPSQSLVNRVFGPLRAIANHHRDAAMLGVAGAHTVAAFFAVNHDERLFKVLNGGPPQ